MQCVFVADQPPPPPSPASGRGSRAPLDIRSSPGFFMIRIQTEEFDPGDEIAAMTSGRTDIGAVVSFSGVVRGDGGLIAMTLEHYPGMTDEELARIEAEARSRWALQDCLIVHRVGRLMPGDGIVLVVTASAHRRDAFEAASFLMDFLKTRAPFWKLEERDGEARWVAPRAEDDAAAGRWTD
jgi:molybdopterin synthase catalytic subunit